MTPSTLLATAERYERHYGCRPGDGGTADQLRAGAEAMLEVERLRAKLDLVQNVLMKVDEGMDWMGLWPKETPK